MEETLSSLLIVNCSVFLAALFVQGMKSISPLPFCCSKVSPTVIVGYQVFIVTIVSLLVDW